MGANWGIILNLLLLIGVIATIAYVMKAKKKANPYQAASPKPSLGKEDFNSPKAPSFNDDIIAVRKVVVDIEALQESVSTLEAPDMNLKKMLDPPLSRLLY